MNRNVGKKTIQTLVANSFIIIKRMNYMGVVHTNVFPN